MTGMLLHSLFVLLGVLPSAVLVQTQDQSGFISIDCGLPENSDYTENSTGLYYISDAKFIDTGVSKSVSPEYKGTQPQQYSYLRSFPSGVRNCYRINVTSGAKYLIRATFYYGNYDGLNEFPQFDLHLGANFWETVNFTSPLRMTFNEIIHTPSLDYIHVCLVNTSTGTPFVSTIELRILNNDTYDTQSSESLETLARYDFGSNYGSNSNVQYRYKDDVYDRIWTPVSAYDWLSQQVSSIHSNDDPIQNDYKLPAIVMRTAATPANGNASFFFLWNQAAIGNSKHYVCVHFYEVEKLAANETREFNITLNVEHWYGPLRPPYRTTTTVFRPLALTGAVPFLFSLDRTEASTVPPIINAAEVYRAKDLSQSETLRADVDAITSIKKAYEVARNWQGDPCAPIKYTWEGLDCSFEGNDPPRITSLNLSSSGLTGQIASSISKLTMFQYLDLSNNFLSGSVPDFLIELRSLKVLNLENNNLTGLVPGGLVDRSKNGTLSLSVGQNPNLYDSTSRNHQMDGTNKKRKKNIVIPVVASVVGTVVLLVIVAGAIICALKKREPEVAVNIHMKPHNTSGSQLESKQQQQYSFDELVKITNNFDTILGRGGFGAVYLGLIDDTQVAIKMLSPSSAQGYQQFVAEVKFLMRVHHRNLTSLIGYCNEESCKGLIYEYMASGNLDEHLLGSSSKAKLLTWEDRLRIAFDAAQGLEYLHNGCKPAIIHRDVKCTNILLNENFQAKLSDLGLSRSFPTEGDTHVTTIIVGTPGYLDPEYQISNRLTEKSDVYSFGVVLLKIITGQPAISRMNDKIHISQRVSSKLANGDIKSIVDSRLQEDFDTCSAWRAVETAMACVSTNSAKRPYMSDVVNELRECLATELARKHVGYDTESKDSAQIVTVNLTTEIHPLAR